MPGVFSANQIVREDLSDAYLQSDVRETPVTARVKKGEELKNFQLYQWAIEQLDGRKTTAIAEGIDVSVFESDQQYRLFNRGMKLWRTPMVTREANDINVAPADFGKYVKQVKKKITEQQRDVELAYLSDTVSSADTGVVGSTTYGLGAVINDGVSVGSAGAAITFSDAQTSIPTQFRTPTAQIYTSNLQTAPTPGAAESPTNPYTPVFFEEQLLNMLQSRYDNLGTTTELICYADSVLKRHFNRWFGKYKANAQGYTVVVRTEAEAIQAKDFSLYGADVYMTPFGNMMVEIAQWLPKKVSDNISPSGRGYILNMPQLQLRPSGRWLTHTQLEDRGAGPRGYIETMWGHEFGDPRTHCKIDPANIVA